MTRIRAANTYAQTYFQQQKVQTTENMVTLCHVTLLKCHRIATVGFTVGVGLQRHTVDKTILLVQ